MDEVAGVIVGETEARVDDPELERIRNVKVEYKYNRTDAVAGRARTLCAAHGRPHTQIIRIFQASKSQENKGDKMHLLYDYLTSTEFSEQWAAIREGFLSMKQSIQKERDTMERLWKAREKQLEKVLLNAAHVRGSIDGIAGKDAIDINLLGDDTGDDLLID